MRPQPSSTDPARRRDDDFDWPPALDELSIHDLEGEPWSHLQAASVEVFAHRHGEPPPPRKAPRASKAQLAAVVGVSAALTVAAVLALRQAMREPPTVAAAAPPIETVVEAPAEAAPPRLNIVATYAVETPHATEAETAPEPVTGDPEPPAAVTPQPAILTDSPLASPTSTEAPAVSGGPAIDESPVATTSLAEPLPAPAAAPTAPWSARADADIRDLLRRYEAAYDQRDVATAASLWPTLDQRALSRAFASLDSQDVSFERCDIDASEGRGSAVCVGTVRYVPRVGRGGEREGRITWTFDLTHSGDDWQIAGLNAR